MHEPTPIPAHHIQWFKSLKKAFINGDIALVSCLDVKTNTPVSVICIVQPDPESDGVSFIPIANMATTDNPYHSYIPPI